MSQLHEFRRKEQNEARDAIIAKLQEGETLTRELIAIGVSKGLFEGETMGVLGTLTKAGAIESAGYGWRKLAGQ